MNKMTEKLKSALFAAGKTAIEDFLGYEISDNEEKDVTNNRMGEALAQMPEEEFQKYWTKYVYQNYYFTFGNSDKFPYQNGWVVIKAENEEQARRLFKALYPGESEDDFLRCSFVYSQKAWETTTMYKTNSNLGYGCHCIITLKIEEP